LAAGRISLILGDPDLAKRQLQQAIANAQVDQEAQAKRGALDARYLLSQALFALGDYEGALKEATAAVEGVPGVPSYHWARAQVLVQLEREDEARQELYRALKLDPENARAKRLLGLIER
jgi:Flp pilus assembly protein TadD